MRKLATITDVARLASVSISTVSRVVNRSSSVSPELADRVQNAIQQLNYHPNALAKNLRRKAVPAIGVILPDLGGAFFTEVFRGIERTCAEHERLAYVANSNNDPENEILFTDQLLSLGVEGIIYVGAFGWEQQEHIEEACDQGIPVVLVNREVENCRVDQVLIDRTRGNYLATNHLIGLGHERIACIAILSHGGTGHEELLGYRSALQEAGLPLQEEFILETPPDLDHGYQTVQTLLAKPSPPSAIFARSDTIAIAAIRAAMDLGYSVPEDISLVGFGDFPVSRYTAPPLTTIRQPQEEMGVLAASMLFERRKTPDTLPQKRIIEPSLVMRASTARAPQYPPGGLHGR